MNPEVADEDIHVLGIKQEIISYVLTLLPSCVVIIPSVTSLPEGSQLGPILLMVMMVTSFVVAPFFLLFNIYAAIARRTRPTVIRLILSAAQMVFVIKMYGRQ